MFATVYTCLPISTPMCSLLILLNERLLEKVCVIFWYSCGKANECKGATGVRYSIHLLTNINTYVFFVYPFKWKTFGKRFAWYFDTHVARQTSVKGPLVFATVYICFPISTPMCSLFILLNERLLEKGFAWHFDTHVARQMNVLILIRLFVVYI